MGKMWNMDFFNQKMQGQVMKMKKIVSWMKQNNQHGINDMKESGHFKYRHGHSSVTKDGKTHEHEYEDSHSHDEKHEHDHSHDEKHEHDHSHDEKHEHEDSHSHDEKHEHGHMKHNWLQEC